MTGKPYDEYVSKAISGVENFHKDYYIPGKSIPFHSELWIQPISVRELRSMLADAWLSGLAYSLNLVEGEKEKRNVHTT